jgi:hypothetical protein
MAKIWIVGLSFAVAVSMSSRMMSQSDLIGIASFAIGELKSLSGLALWLFADDQFGGRVHTLTVAILRRLDGCVRRACAGTLTG